MITDIYSLLRFEEGERLTVYDDRTGYPIVPGSVVQGHPTIGVGIRLDAGAGILQSESDRMLANRVGMVTGALAALTWYLALDVIRRWAIVSMAFAMGVRGVGGFTTMIADLEKEHAEAIAALRRQDWQAAHDAVLASAWAKSEAPARAGRVAGMLLTGQWPVIDISS